MLIYGKKIKKEILDKVVEYVRGKRLKNLDRDFILDKVEKYLNENKKVVDKIVESKEYKELRRSGTYKTFIKEIRRLCNIAYGMFYTEEIKKLDKYLEQLKQDSDSLELHNKLLSLHKSTKERLPYYKQIYKRILGGEKSILDLGSGFNIFSYPYIGRDVKYYAGDLNVDFINKYMKIKNIKGKAFKVDLFNVKNLPRADVCFLFKILDSIDVKGHKNSENLIKKINCKKIVVSFPLKTLKKREMTTQRRAWLELMLKRLNYEFKSFKIGDELFYVVNKI